MIDDPEKTAELLQILQDAVPFGVAATPSLSALLKSTLPDIAPDARFDLVEVTYAGDPGGIMCRIKSEGGASAIVSLTHLRVHAKLPFAASVYAYQKHRVKKLRKQSSN
jgi:hypothetical protein